MSETTFVDLTADVAGRLSADSYLSDITILVEDKGDIVSDVAQTMNVRKPASGKKLGICAIVRMPIGMDEFEDVLFGPLDFDLDVTVIEHPTLNRNTGAGGSGKRALSVARRIYRVLKNYVPGGIAQNLVPRKQCVVPTEEFAPLPAYNVMFSTREADPTNYQKVSTPVLDNNGGPVPLLSVFVTCATAGATIYYTTDGTHPWSGNATAQQPIVGAIPIAAPCTLRVAAVKAGLIESDCVAAVFT